VVDATEDFQQHIYGKTAGLIIGDRSFEQRKVSKYAYDLGEAWKNYSGLPFVFAAWISNQPLDADFIKMFNEANAFGIQNIPKVISTLNFNSSVDLEEYFRQYISYNLDDAKRKALRKFMQYLQKDIIV
jgi:chorismate dehydratase